MQNRKSINESFEELGKQFRGSIPHLVIGKETIKKAVEKPKTVEIVKPEIYSNVSSYPNVLKEPVPEDKDEYFTPKQEKWLKRLKAWGMIICVLAVVIYALYRVIWFW